MFKFFQYFYNGLLHALFGPVLSDRSKLEAMAAKSPRAHDNGPAESALRVARSAKAACNKTRRSL